ncbi:MAG TPA: DUF4147 domain-containing protein [Pyrinomonadaceae bacterium]|nr:DUF4147 domain-containing protein [Pyrinomonadaceae bacterium]
MPELNELHRYARAIFDHALSSVDPRTAVKQAINVNGPIVDIGEARLDVSSRNVYAIAIGKAARSMALGLEEALGRKLVAGVITAPEPFVSNRWQSFVGGHPLPDESSLEAAQATFALLDRANAEAALVIFLISGGGSAMLEWPISGDISLGDLRLANQLLVTCGARIAEINSVRRAFSAVKGGGLARRAPRAQTFTLMVSDTNPGDEASVASGPTLSPPPDAPDAIDVIERYQLQDVLPRSILKAIEQSKPQRVTGTHQVLLDNWTAVQAAFAKARELGFAATTAQDICEQPIEEGCDLLLSRIMQTTCLISGGEFSCPVRGHGLGGRNLETALRCAIKLERETEHFLLLSAGTDGIDGNSLAAGAIADETTLKRARALGLDAHQFLERSDSYSFFQPLADVIVTGPTGTNVRDIRIFLRSS